MSKIRLCWFTGSRAEFGLCKDLISYLDRSNCFEIILLVSGSHLADSASNTISEIRSHLPTLKVYETYMQLDNTSAVAVAKSAGILLISLPEMLQTIDPDLFILFGDRYETATAGLAAYILGIPLVHFQGGEQSLGAIDNGLRYMLSKLASLHFVSADLYADNLLRMGEHRDKVFSFGSLNSIPPSKYKDSSREDICSLLGICADRQYVIVTVHPETNNPGVVLDGVNSIFQLISKRQDLMFIWTLPNADSESFELSEAIKHRSNEVMNLKLKVSLGRRLFLDALSHSKGIIGNSSSGIYESIACKVPGLNIGNRQKGRLHGMNVLDASWDAREIEILFEQMLSEEHMHISETCDNPFYKQDTFSNILNVLRAARISRYPEKSLP